MRRAFTLIFVLIVPLLAFAQGPSGVVRLPGMDFPGRITRDSNGIPQILAFNRHDLYFLNGYVHAQDRLFQMDYNRRLASGTLAELVGAAALPTDVQLRTLGLKRAAESSYNAYSQRAKDTINAYTAGVNAYLDANPALPPEYASLEITTIPDWTPADSVVIGKLIAFGLAFDLSDIDATVALRTYQQVGQAAGFNGAALFFEDLFRSAPFDPASTVPDARSIPEPDLAAQGFEEADWSAMGDAAADLDAAVIDLARDYMQQLSEIRFFDQIRIPEMEALSNEWGIAGRNTTTGRPMIANDPHLALGMPSTFYPIILRAGRINVAGHSFPGAPGVILGHNARIAWGATNIGYDVTDVYQEQVVPDPTASGLAGLSSMYKGQREWLFPIVQVFRQNVIGNNTPNDLAVVPSGGAIPPATLIVARRNAPIVSLDLATGAALSVQWVGAGPTRELETFMMWAEAENIDDFKEGLQFFDFGAQNWAYTDVEGNVAYFTSGEVPVREDLQSGQVTGLPPSFIRNGLGGNDWIRVVNTAPTQATPAQVIPFEELPQVVNPAAGYFVNANNDPAGTTLDNNPLNETRPGGGIFYLARWYSNGLRAGRIKQMIQNELAGNGKISFEEMQAMQSDVVMLDAQYFTPLIRQALTNAQAAGANPALAQFGNNPAIVAAVNRLANWNFSTPTGIPEGFDASDVNGQRVAPSQGEIDNSVAATIYSVWRGRFIANTIDPVINQIRQQVPSFPGPNSNLVLAALRNLLENMGTRGGRGASGLQFFNVPPIPDTVETAPLRRDILILKSVADTLALLAGDEFKPAFNNSTNLNDYRWGKLHRIVFRHNLGGPLSVPGPGAHPLGDALPGFPTDGGYEVVDASGHSPRASTVNGFMFGSGPVRRFVAEGGEDGIHAVTALPGGVSGVPTSPLYLNLLPLWLTNEAYPSVLLSAPRLPFINN